MRRFRRGLTAVGVAVATLVTAAPAQAVAAFGPPVRVTPYGCRDEHTATSPTGAVHGFVTCYDRDGAHLFYAQGGYTSAWSLRPLDYTVARVLDVADDGTATYLLYDTGNRVIRMLKRTHAGATTSWRLAAPDTLHYVQFGALAAVHGRWWAVWTLNDGAGGSTVWQAKTMGTRQGPHATTLHLDQVRLAPLSDANVEIVGVRYPHDYGGPLLYAFSYDTRWGPGHVLDGASFESTPDILRAGGVTSVTWIGNVDNNTRHVVHYADNRGGSWHRHTFAGDARTGPALLAASAGHVFVGWHHQPADGKLLPRVAERYAGTWTERTLAAPASSNSWVRIADLAAVGGRARVVLDTLRYGDGYGDYVFVRRQ